MARKSLEDIEDIIASDPRFAGVNPQIALANYLDATRERNATALPEVTVTATKKKKKELTYKDIDPTQYTYEDIVKANNESNPINKTLSYGAKNFEHTFGVSPKEIAYFIPGIGDALSADDIAQSLSNRDYLSAGVGAAMLAVPNVVEKPLKKGLKYFGKKFNSYVNALTGKNLDRISKLKWEMNQRGMENDIVKNKLYETYQELRPKVDDGRYFLKELEEDLEQNKFLYNIAYKDLTNDAFKYLHNNTVSPKKYIIPGTTSKKSLINFGNYVDEYGHITPIVGNNNSNQYFETIIGGHTRNLGLSLSNKSYQIPFQYTTTDNLIPLLNEREQRLNAIIGEHGKLTGSSKLAQQGYISHIPGDDDIITTAGRYETLKNALEANEVRPLRDNIGYLVNSRKLRGGQSDIDIIQERNGKATGALAHELYQFINPKEYARLRNEYAKKGAVENIFTYKNNYFENTELPISAEELYSKLNDDVIGKKALSDLLFSHNDKHTQRRIQLFANKEKYPQIEEVINNKFNSLYGKDIELNSNFDLNDIEANKKVLNLLNFDESLANDPKAMELISKYMYLAKGSHTRRIKPETLPNTHDKNLLLKDIDKTSNATFSYSGASYAGRGGNYTTGAYGGGKGYGDYGVVTTDYIPEKFDNPYKLYNYLNNSKGKLSPRNQEAILKEFPDFTGSTLIDTHYATTEIPNTEEANAKLADILGRKFSIGTQFNDNDIYIGRLKPGDLLGSNYSYNRGFEHGVITKRNISDAATDINYLTNKQFIEGLRKHTLKGNAFHRDYSKALKIVKSHAKEKRKKYLIAMNNLNKDISQTKNIMQGFIEQYDDAVNKLNHRILYTKTINNRFDKFSRIYNKQKITNKKVKNYSKAIAGSTALSIPAYYTTKYIANKRKERKSLED